MKTRKCSSEMMQATSENGRRKSTERGRSMVVGAECKDLSSDAAPTGFARMPEWKGFACVGRFLAHPGNLRARLHYHSNHFSCRLPHAYLDF